MKKLVKVFGYLVGLLFAAVVAAMVAAPFVIDPNDYRAEIAEQVEKATGRPFSIEGEIGLSVFPWLGLELGGATLANADGFGDAPFARVERVEVRAKLMPLLSQQLEMDTVLLKGVELNLIRAADGTTNWQDLAGGGGGEAKPQTKGGAGAKPLAAFAIGGIDLSEARILWDDRMTGTSYRLDGMSLRSGAVASGEPVDLSLTTDFASSAPELAGRVALTTRLAADPKEKRLTLSDLVVELKAAGGALAGKSAEARMTAEVTLDGVAQRVEIASLRVEGKATGEGLPGGRAAGRLAADVKLDGKAKRVEVRGLDGELLGMPLRGDVTAVGEKITANLATGEFDPRPLLAALGQTLPEGSKLERASMSLEAVGDAKSVNAKNLNLTLGALRIDGALNVNDLANPRYDGTLNLAPFSPRELLAMLGQAAPETADPKVLNKLSANLRVNGTRERVALPKIEIEIDDTAVNGSIHVDAFDKPAVRFNLNANAIDVDRYLPPPPPAGAGTAAKQEGAAVGLPLDVLRQLKLDGKVKIGRLKAGGVRADAVVVTLTARDGVIKVDPATANLYQGRMENRTTLDVRGKEPRFNVAERLSGVSVGPLLRDLTGEDRLEGKGDVTVNLNGSGMTPETVTKSLGGNLNVKLANGAVKGVNVAQLLREANARFKGEAVPPAENNETDFSALTATAKIAKGVVDNRDFSLKSPLLRVNGAGTADLPASRVDYGLKVAVVGTLKGQGGEDLGNLKGLTIPLRVKGPFNDLSYKLDVGDLLKERAKEEVKKKLQEKLLNKAQEQVQQKTQEKVEDQLKQKLLEGLFR